MVKLSSIIKGIILYTLFVIGISILSQYLGKKNNQLDYLLDSIKEELKKEYLSKIENFTPIYSQPRHRYNYQPIYTNTNTNNQNINIPEPVKSDEEKILQEVNKRLQLSSMTFDDNQYTQLNKSNYIPLATSSDFSFQNTEYPWKRGITNTGAVETLQKYSGYQIDNHMYTPNSNEQFLPQKLGFQNGQFTK